MFRGCSKQELATHLGIPAERVESRIRSLLQIEGNGVRLAPSLPEVKHPRLNALLGLWNIRRRTRALPAHRALRLTDLQPWIGHLAVTELVDVPPQPKVRILGKRCIDYFGRDNSGKYIADCIPEALQLHALQPYRLCVSDRSPQYNILGATAPGFDSLELHRLLLPHSFNGRDVDIVVTAIYLQASEQRQIPPAGFFELPPRKAG